jgi:PAS domain S-box-containing protein
MNHKTRRLPTANAAGGNSAIATREAPAKRYRELFDSSVLSTTQQAVDFIADILASSTEHSVIAMELEGKILVWNEGARRLYGYEPGEIVGRANVAILDAPENVAEGVSARIRQTALEKGKWEGTLTRRRKNGETFVARVAVTPRHDPSGNPTGFLLISNDISNEIRMTQYARSLIEASLDPLVTISPEGKITDVNEAATKVTGVPRESLIGTDFANYFTEPEKAREGYQQTFAHGFVTDYPLTILNREGEFTHVLYNASVYRDVNGHVLGVFAAARDITPLKKAELELAKQRNRDLERLAELERFQKLTVGRELKMIELKKEIEELKQQLALQIVTAGRP